MKKAILLGEAYALQKLVQRKGRLRSESAALELCEETLAGKPPQPSEPPSGQPRVSLFLHSASQLSASAVNKIAIHRRILPRYCLNATMKAFLFDVGEVQLNSPELTLLSPASDSKHTWKRIVASKKATSNRLCSIFEKVCKGA